MVEFYSSWVKGLVDNDKALQVLVDSPLIAGVETPDEGEHKKFQSKGLKISFHNPVRWLKLDLTHQGLANVLGKKENRHILRSINNSDCRTVGFHASHGMHYYLENHVLKRKLSGYEIPQVLDREYITKIIAKNLLELEKKINLGLPGHMKKIILFETTGYYDYEQMNEFKRLSKDEQQRLKKIESMTGYLSSVEFIRKVFKNRQIAKNKRIGLLFDVSHLLVAANTRLLKKEVNVSIDEYLDDIIEAAKDRVFQMHLNVVIKDGLGYIDAHKPFVKGDSLSKIVLKIAKKVIEKNPETLAITMEIDSDKEPLAHAKRMVEQALLISKELELASSYFTK